MLLFSGLTYDMKSLIVKDSPNRIQIIDGLRGLSILLMVAYHFGYDLVIFVGVSPQLIHNPVLDVLQSFFCWLVHPNVWNQLPLLQKQPETRSADAPGCCRNNFGHLVDRLSCMVWHHSLLRISAILFSIVSPAIDKISRPVQFIIYIVLFLCSIQFTGRRYDVSCGGSAFVLRVGLQQIISTDSVVFHLSPRNPVGTILPKTGYQEDSTPKECLSLLLLAETRCLYMFYISQFYMS